MSKYIAILYKPDTDDYCMGQHMGSFPAQHEILDTNQEDEIINSIVGSIVVLRDHNDTNYELTLFIDGERILSSVNPSDYIWEGEEGSEILKKIQNLIQEKAIEEKERRKNKLKQERDKINKEIEENELKQRDALLKKYPLNN